MIYATITDAINSYLADFKNWSVAILIIAAVLLMASAVFQRHSVAKMIMAGLAVTIALAIALYPTDFANKMKEDVDNRSGALAHVDAQPPTERTW